MNRFTVVREHGDLDRSTWEFSLIAHGAHLVLEVDYFALEARPSTRHKFRAKGFYRRWNQRANTLSITDVPLPDDVAAEAKRQLCAAVVVHKEWTR